MSDLTPIRVRGTRARNKRTLEDNDASSSRERGRARRQAAAEDANAALRKGQPKSTPLSPLERMPTEILELIFAYSENVDLPGCSLLLARSLSTTHTYQAIWAAAAELTNQGPMPARATQITRLLQCRWMTWSAFKSVIIAWFEAGPTSCAPDPYAYADKDDKLLQKFARIRTSGVMYIFDSDVRVPLKLLHGPWTEDKVQFLHWLCQAGAFINWEHSSAGEVATSGLDDAIAARNRLAVACLVGDMCKVKPTQQQMRAAIIDEGCDETIVFHMLSAWIRASADEHNPYDQEAQYAWQIARLNSDASEFEEWRQRAADREFRRQNDPTVKMVAAKYNARDPEIWQYIPQLRDADKAKWLKGALTRATALMTTTSRPGGIGDGVLCYGRHWRPQELHKAFERDCGQPPHVQHIAVPFEMMDWDIANHEWELYDDE